MLWTNHLEHRRISPSAGFTILKSNSAFVAGFILNRLPLGQIVGGMFRLLRLALKPAILIYGATKLYQAAQEEE